MAPLRRPRAAAITQPLPTLATLLAGGAVLLGCHDPLCGSSRSAELESHAPILAQDLRTHDVPSALDEIGVAIGLLPHHDLFPAPVYRGTTAGAVSITTPAPPAPPTRAEPVPPRMTAPRSHGARRAVQPHPVDPHHAQPPPQRNILVGEYGTVTIFPVDRRRV